MQAPCKDCPDRKPLCHSTCEKYIAFRKYRDEILVKKWEFYEREREYFGSRKKGRKK